MPHPLFAAQAEALASRFSNSAAARDLAGGTPKAERELLRDSGLLNISVPVELGGGGASWRQTLETVRILARADSSLAHVYAFHHLLLATTRLFGSDGQWRDWQAQSVAQRQFWGNALNPLDRRTVATRAPGGYLFDGQKSFCSGALDSDRLLLSALEEGSERLLIAVVPTDRAGIELFGDWNNMGQRQTDSGSARFDRVAVHDAELLLDPGPLSSPYACLRPLLAQLILASIYLGIAEGALAQAGDYTRSQARAWHFSAASEARRDPYTLRHYGEFWLAIEAAATAKLAADRAGLDITSRIFEVMGARATHARLRLDRFWRNVRTHTLHDPADYKLAELGNWALNREYPQPSFYS
ncbi:acyl-CoA dehydrogenase family protein [Chitinilyticum litopenaei]|uniref:acyl-CoA dehydrogenase family protein n=1 Tax=Chitinilyticum litopenaei TaxID=1121276 RepID=UPI001FE1D278|nr:acyl-CoA dehydrogenase family protein [Chitinilyticum litopenaei]